MACSSCKGAGCKACSGNGLPGYRPGLSLLTPQQAKNSFVSRFAPKIARLRQATSVKLGLRPYNVFLVWTKWTGTERGEGHEKEIKRVPILPTPKVEDLTSISFNLVAAGAVPTGSVRVSKIASVYTADMLTGHVFPTNHEDFVPEPYEFFYEIVEDGRGDPEPVRQKFRIFSFPFRKASTQEWNLVLERVSEDRSRQGKSTFAGDTCK